MLKINDYAVQIEHLHNEGKNALEISKILNFKYSQPVYNYFKKKGWPNLEKGKYIHYTKYVVDSTFFNVIDTEEKAYILGFICSDGHIDAKNYRLTISLKDSDYALLEAIRRCMDSTHPIKRHIKFNKDIMKYVPEYLVRHFLRGYFDGDGSVTWGKHYSSGNKYLIQVAGNEDFLLESFQKHFPSNCGLYKYKTSKQCYVWKLADKKKVLEFLNYIYNDAKIYLDRKYKIYKYAMWACKTELIAGNSYFISLIKGQSAANPLVKCLRQVQRLADETIKNPFEEEIEYNSATNAQHQELQINLDEDIVRTI